MAFFLRYTATPEADLNRGYSLHITGIAVGQMLWDPEDDRSEEEILADAYGLDADSIIIVEINGQQMFAQQLDGLCGFALEADTLEEAVEEAKGFHYNDVYNSTSMGDLIAIFEGEELSSSDCPEGCLFQAEKICYSSGANRIINEGKYS